MTAEPASGGLEQALPDEGRRWVLHLYVAGVTSQSQRAIANVRAVCDDALADRYELEVIDVFQQPALAEGEQIIAAPTLVKELPLPVRRLVGDMSDRQRLLLTLDLGQVSG